MFRLNKRTTFVQKQSCILFYLIFAVLIYKFYHFTNKSLKFHYTRFHKIEPRINLKHYENKKPFIILFWTDWYGGDAKGFNKPACENEFRVISNRSQYESADVIVFQYVDLLSNNDIELPKTRKPNVPWILTLQEASINHALLDTKKYNGVFNFTATFRTDSEINTVFNETLQLYRTPDRKWECGSKFSHTFVRNKTNLAALVVSNCHIQPSKRNELVSSLRQHGIQVDIYGKCGSNQCEQADDCFSKLGKKYKFYLALENSLCVDYVTEKITHGLFHGMVPIVWALGKLDDFAPPGSYIDAMKFPTVRDLADRIKFLDKNDEEYFKYFEWRKFYNLSSINDSSYICCGWRKMKHVTESFLLQNRTHVYENLEEWYHYFRSENTKRLCSNCLEKYEVNLEQLKMNKLSVYNGTNYRCI